MHAEVPAMSRSLLEELRTESEDEKETEGEGGEGEEDRTLVFC